MVASGYYRVCPHRNVAAAYRRFYGESPACALLGTILRKMASGYKRRSRSDEEAPRRMLALATRISV